MSNILHTQPSLQLHLQQNLRQRRKSAGMTQDALATAAGISRRMVAAIETHGANASLLTVEKLAQALGTTLGDLIAAPTAAGAPRAEPNVMWNTGRGSYGALLSAMRVNSAVEVWECSLAAGELYEGKPDPPGTNEFVYMVEGEVLFEMGAESRRIEKGSSMIFGPQFSYSFANRGKESAFFIRVITT